MSAIQKKKKNWKCNASAKFIYCVLEKNFSFMHICIFMKSTSQKHDLRTWDWHSKLDFMIGAYRILKKKSSCVTLFIGIYIYIYIAIRTVTYEDLIYVCIYIYIYIYIWE